MNEKCIELILPLPISINEAYAGKSKRYKSKKYKEWEEDAKKSLMLQKRYTITGDNWLSVKYLFLMPLYCKNGNKKIQDVGNYEKVLTDVLTHNIPGFLDHKIKHMELDKEEGDGKVLVRIYELTK